MAGSASKNSKTPLQKNLSRRVSFNEATLAKAAAPPPDNHPPPPPTAKPRPKPPTEPDDSSVISSVDVEAQGMRRRAPRKCSSRFNSCCAWASLVVGVLLILFLLLGGLYFAFLQSNLPEVHLQRLDINKLEVENTKTDTLLTADFVVRLNATNKNDKVELSYGSMVASITSEGIGLGSVKLGPVHQRPETSSDLMVRTAVKKKAVEEAVAKDLQDNSKTRTMVIDVEVKGHIDFLVNGKKMNGFPFKVVCNRIDQSEIDNGHAPKCNVKMSPIY